MMTKKNEHGKLAGNITLLLVRLLTFSSIVIFSTGELKAAGSLSKYSSLRMKTPLQIESITDEVVFVDDFSQKIARGGEVEIIKESVTDINLVITEKGLFKGQGNHLWYPDYAGRLPSESECFLHLSFSIHALEASSEAPYEISARFALAPQTEFAQGKINPDDSLPNLNIVVLRNTAKNEVRIGFREKDVASPYQYEGLGTLQAERYVCCLTEVKFPIKVDLFVNQEKYILNLDKSIQELKGERSGAFKGFGKAVGNSPLGCGVFLGGPHTPGASTQGVRLENDRRTDLNLVPLMLLDDFKMEYVTVQKVVADQREPEIFHVEHEPEWELLWNDEFDGDKVDENKWWIQDSGAKTTTGKASRSRAKSNLDGKGNLLLKFDYDKEQNSIIYGGVVSKPFWRYGYFEAKIKLCSFGSQCGWWSSFWMGDAYNPLLDGMEIDILEGSGNPETKTAHIGTTLHANVYFTKNPRKTFSKRVEIPQPWDGFHVYGFKWTPLEMVFFVDGVETARWNYLDVASTRPLQIRMTCVGGKVEKASALGKSITDYQVVDYVRVYQHKDTHLVPTVAINNPNLDHFPEQKKLSESIEIIASANAQDGSEITSVLLFDNGYFLESLSAPPYRFKVTFDNDYFRTKPYLTSKPNYGGVNFLDGNHVFAVFAQDSKGRVGVSEKPLIVQVNSMDYDAGKKGEAFAGQPQKLPGKLLIRNHDEGGQHIGYRKNEPEKDGEEGFRRGYGWTKSLDWAKYTVEVTQSGRYMVSVSLDKRNMEERSGLVLFCDGKWLCNLFAGTENPDGFKIISANDVQLEAGHHELTVMFVSYFLTGPSIEFKLEE